MQWISVVVVAGDHWMSAVVQADGRRFLDVLNDKSSEILTVEEPRIYLGPEMTEPVVELPRAAIPKHNIVIAMLMDPDHEAPRKRAAHFVRKDTFDAYLTIPGFELKGYIHLSARTDAATFLSRLAKENTPFFPMTASSVSALGPLGEPAHAPVTFVNRSFVDLLFIADMPSLS